MELQYVGRNHSDNSLMMRVPQDRILFAVDFNRTEMVNFRDMLDFYVPD